MMPTCARPFCFAFRARATASALPLPTGIDSSTTVYPLLPAGQRRIAFGEGCGEAGGAAAGGEGVVGSGGVGSFPVVIRTVPVAAPGPTVTRLCVATISEEAFFFPAPSAIAAAPAATATSATA